MVTLIGPGLNFPQDAVYPFSEKDADGEKYDGAAHKYVMRFEKGQMPPVKGFWSLTMYDPEFFFVPNPINRYNLSQRNTFVTNPDGSVDLYLQAESPGPDKEANWLPAPKGKFIPMLRLYWPQDTPPSILDGSWKPPAVNGVLETTPTLWVCTVILTMEANFRTNGRRAKRWTLAISCAALIASAGGCVVLKEGRAWLYGLEAYIYGFPLIMMDLTKEAATAVPPPERSPPRSTSSPS